MRLGIIGWCAPTGLGQMNQTLYDYFLADCKWLVPQHPKTGVEFYADVHRPDFIRCQRDIARPELNAFLEGLDAVIIAERSFLTSVNIWDVCREKKIFTVCIPMLEFLPPPREAPWVLQPDMMWAVNYQAYAKLLEYSAHPGCNWRRRIHFDNWGINLSQFHYQHRAKCNRFLFINGWGGEGNRKGADIVAAASRLCPDVPLTVCSQTPKLPDFRCHVDVRIVNPPVPAALYDLGDMLLAPSRWEGLGLQLREAYASGMPVITSNAAPMNELPGVCTVTGHFAAKAINSQRTVHAYETSAKSLAGAMTSWCGRDIGKYSLYVRNVSQQFNHQRVLNHFRDTLGFHLEVCDIW